MQLREWGGKNISPQYRKIVMSLIKIKRALRTTEVGAEFNVLGYIARHDYETPATPSQIAHHLYMTMPMVTKVIRTLSKKRYIIVATDVQDRRKVHLQLSEAGKRNFKHKITTIHKWYLSIFNKLGKNDFQVFVDLLDKVANIAINNVKAIKNV